MPDNIIVRSKHSAAQGGVTVVIITQSFILFLSVYTDQSRFFYFQGCTDLNKAQNQVYLHKCSQRRVASHPIYHVAYYRY